MGKIKNMSEVKNFAVQAPGAGERLELVKTKMPETPAKGVVIKIHCTGICHSDVHIWQDKFKINEEITVTMQQLNPAFTWPFILGHEVAGEIHSVGSEAESNDLSVGDRVAVYPWIGCGDCSACHHDHNNHCPLNACKDIGIAVAGGYQYYMAVRDTSFIKKLDDNVEMDVACMFGCSALTSYNASCKAKESIERAAKILGEARFLIIGAGGLGLWTISIARTLFPDNTKIYVADVDEEKLKLAKEHGADETIFWPRDGDAMAMIEKTKEATGGIDGSVDYVGITATIQRAFQAARKGATIVQVGLAGGVAQVSLVEMTLKDIAVRGAFVGTMEQMSELIQLYTHNKMKPPPLIKVTPDETPDAIQKLKDGKVAGRSIIHFV